MVDECLRTPATVWRAAFAGLSGGQLRRRSRCASPHRCCSSGAMLTPSCPEADQQRLCSRFRRRLRVVYRGVGHAVHWEQPERFALDVDRFVDSLDRLRNSTDARRRTRPADRWPPGRPDRAAVVRPPAAGREREHALHDGVIVPNRGRRCASARIRSASSLRSQHGFGARERLPTEHSAAGSAPGRASVASDQPSSPAASSGYPTISAHSAKDSGIQSIAPATCSSGRVSRSTAVASSTASASISAIRGSPAASTASAGTRARAGAATTGRIPSAARAG